MCHNAYALQTETIQYAGHHYDIVRIDLRTEHLELFWKDEQGVRYGSIARLRDALEARGDTLLFATNAGIFDPEYTPLGLYIENQQEYVPINRKRGKGNFYMQLNGVFFIRGDSTAIVPTDLFRAMPGIVLATQSGPLLLYDGAINPAFQNPSPSLYIRSGVGVINAHSMVFAISREPVGFYEFAALFKNSLKCGNALYLDGSISRMYVKGFRELDTGGDFAGIIALRTH